MLPAPGEAQDLLHDHWIPEDTYALDVDLDHVAVVEIDLGAAGAGVVYVAGLEGHRLGSLSPHELPG